MFLAAPLGRIPVTPRPAARLLDDPALWNWLDRVRQATRDLDKTPARYSTAVRQVDRALFAFANRSERGNDAGYLLQVLAALGRAERTFATGLRFCKTNNIRPLQGLNPAWLDQADDDSAEFGIAAALAGIAATDMGKVGPLRTHLEDVEGGADGRRYDWQPGSSSAVWSRRPLADNLAAVFQRRQLEAFRAGHAGVPIDSPRAARLDDVLAFLDDATDDGKLSDLLWGLSAVGWSAVRRRLKRPKEPARRPIPFEFAVRLLVQPDALVPHRIWGSHPRTGEPVSRLVWRFDNDVRDNVQPDPDVFHLLAARRANSIEQAVSHAARRLRTGGLLVTGYRNRRQAGREIALRSPISPERLLAALLIPLSRRALARVANAVLYPPEAES